MNGHLKQRLAACLKIFASIIFPFFDTITILSAKKSKSDNRVLIVRLDAIGDFVLWLESAQSLFNFYRAQGKSVTLLGNQAWADWAKALGIADEIWEMSPRKFIKNFRYRWAWITRVRETGFSVVVQPTFSRDLLTGDTIVRASAAPVRVGSVGDCTNTWRFLKYFSDRWYTHLIQSAPMPQMELQRHAEFVQGLTGAPKSAVIPILNAPSNINLDIIPSTPFVVLFTAASWSGRMWPASRFGEIGQRLMATGRRVVLAGGPGDELSAEAVAAHLGGQALNLVGKTSLPQLAELIRQADLLLTNETSAVHIGAGVSARVLCILGGGHYGRFAPYALEQLQPMQRLPAVVAHPMPCFNCNWNCKYPRAVDAPVKCIDEIGVDEIWAAVLKILT